MVLSVCKDVAVRLPRKRLNRLFEIVCEEEGDPDWPGQVNLILTTDRRLRSLNRDYRARDKNTDVLSFNIDQPDASGAVFGEIYIAIPFAQRQAHGYGGSASGEYLRLFCHGMLHLFGYDHTDAPTEKKMIARQDSYLERLTTGGRP